MNTLNEEIADAFVVAYRGMVEFFNLPSNIDGVSAVLAYSCTREAPDDYKAKDAFDVLLPLIADRLGLEVPA